MSSIVSTVSGSELSPIYLDVVILAGSDQIVRMFIRPTVAGGISGQSFTLKLERSFDDAAPLLVAGAISDAVGCTVDFAISAAASAALIGRYIASIRRTDSGNAAPLAVGQARVIQS